MFSASSEDYSFTFDALSADHPLVDAWHSALRTHRGGPALFDEITGGASIADYLSDSSHQNEHIIIRSNASDIGFALLRNGVLLALFVTPALRRRGIASAFIVALRASGVEVVDARALPGDRGTKSLFESLGWKARLLTMRDGPLSEK